MSSLVVISTIVLLTTAFAIVPGTGVEYAFNSPSSTLKFVLLVFSILIFLGVKLVFANSVPDVSLNLIDTPAFSSKLLATKSKLSPIVETVFGTAVILIVVSASDTFAVSVITFNALFSPYSVEPIVNVDAVASLTLNISPAVPPMLLTSNTTLLPTLNA